MADLHPDRGAILSILESLGRPGQAIKNLAAGRFGSAARQIGQLGLDVVDASLPGDWLPNDFAKPEDDISGQELIGATGDDIGSKAAGFAVDVLTDPLTYLSGGASTALKGGSTALKFGVPFLKDMAVEIPGSARAIAAGKGLLSKGVDALPQGVKDAGQTLAQGARETFNRQSLSPEVATAVATARATKSGVSQAGIKSLDELLKGTTPEQQSILGEIGHNIQLGEDGRPIGLIDPTESLPIADRAATRLAGRPDAELLTTLAQKIGDFGKRQFETGRDTLGIFKDGEGVEDYFPRQFSGVKAGEVTEDAFGRPSAIKGRTLGGSSDVLDFLKNNPDVNLEFNAQKALGARAEQQGNLAGKASLGQSLVGDGFQYANELDRGAMTDLLKVMPAEDAQVVGDLYNGLPQRGALAGLLAKSNALFKPYATAGYMIPKIGFNVRNKVSAIFQTLANPEARGATGGQAKRLVSDIGGAIGDAMGLATKDKLGQTVNAWDDALRTSGGDYHAALDTMRATSPEAADLIQHGVMDGFIRSEDMLSAAKKGGLLGKVHKVGQWPSKITQGLEDRMRLGLGLDLVAAGKAPQDAAKIVRDTMFDFSVSSGKNRAFRDMVPFGNYLANVVPQQAKFLAEKPAAASVVGHLFQQDDDHPVMPFMQGKVNIPVGGDNYITGLGLPFESLSQIPNPSASIQDFGRQAEQDVVGASQPLLKSLYSTVSGRDPYFGTSYGSYSKVPVAGDLGEAGRLYNQVAGTGATSVIDQPLRVVDQALDDRKPALMRALDIGTGLNFATVDTDRALQQQLTDALDRNPGILKVSTPINVSKDPEVQQLLDALKGTRQRIKAKKQQEALLP